MSFIRNTKLSTSITHQTAQASDIWIWALCNVSKSLIDGMYYKNLCCTNPKKDTVLKIGVMQAMHFIIAAWQ
jgi:hypothetical protein